MQLRRMESIRDWKPEEPMATMCVVNDELFILAFPVMTTIVKAAETTGAWIFQNTGKLFTKADVDVYWNDEPVRRFRQEIQMKITVEAVNIRSDLPIKCEPLPSESAA